MENQQHYVQKCQLKRLHLVERAHISTMEIANANIFYSLEQKCECITFC